MAEQAKQAENFAYVVERTLIHGAPSKNEKTGQVTVPIVGYLLKDAKTGELLALTREETAFVSVTKGVKGVIAQVKKTQKKDSSGAVISEKTSFYVRGDQFSLKDEKLLQPALGEGNQPLQGVKYSKALKALLEKKVTRKSGGAKKAVDSEQRRKEILAAFQEVKFDIKF